MKNPISLIAGAAGFIGSHLAEKLLSENHYVIGVDNFLTGSFENIENLKQHDRFKFIEHDIRKKLNYSEPIDFIYHLASPASPIDYHKIPIETMEVNTLGTINLIELAANKNSKFLCASTSEIYGNPSISPQPETYNGNVNPVGPRSVYDEAKRFMETITVYYGREYKVSTKIARIFNTYGPRMRLNDGRILPTFLGQIMSGSPITIFGDGSQTRSFCYVDDLIDGLYKLMLSDFSGPVNLGNPEEISVVQFAHELIDLIQTRKKVALSFKELPTDDPLQRKPEISLAKNKLNWSPHISRKIGLKLTIDWYMQNYSKVETVDLIPKNFSN